MPLETPLEIPEIMLLVASCLRDEELAQCLRVSRTWRDLFRPLRWREVRVGHKFREPPFNSSGDYPRCFGPRPVDIYHHRDLILDLTLFGDTAGLDKYNYPNLHKLAIDYTCGTGDSEQKVDLALTEMFPSLIDLRFEKVPVGVTSWITLFAHHHIRILTLCNILVNTDDAPTFWKACAKLENLEMDRVIIQGGRIPADMMFDRMRTLYVWEAKEMDETSLIDLALRCPKLEELILATVVISPDTPPKPINLPIPKECWPHLENLQLECNIQDADLGSILEGVGNLICLDLHSCTMGEQAFRALGLHFSTLVELNLQNCFSATSSMFRDIMCSCPELEVLKANNVFANDVTEGGPWVCQLLRKLKICFLFGSSETYLQLLIFERLSTLVQLECLTLYYLDFEYYDERRILEFRLDFGLSHLESLKQLTTLDFNYPYVPQIGMLEVAWMKTNWQNLTRISGELNDNPNENERVISALSKRGIYREWSE
ncbi:hypothetical protein BGZ65_007555 [Modicella reniformis]|uniref:F-box domain-containing protein n=1 Tax=Modicella reniformis TaxID=1440133 RepID=A0A9P6MKG3_9FUNG|nr:hypothetical protein BGZ65_007555 [Modicella reniformis]